MSCPSPIALRAGERRRPESRPSAACPPRRAEQLELVEQRRTADRSSGVSPSVPVEIATPARYAWLVSLPASATVHSGGLRCLRAAGLDLAIDVQAWRRGSCRAARMSANSAAITGLSCSNRDASIGKRCWYESGRVAHRLIGEIAGVGDGIDAGIDHLGRRRRERPFRAPRPACPGGAPLAVIAATSRRAGWRRSSPPSRRCPRHARPRAAGRCSSSIACIHGTLPGHRALRRSRRARVVEEARPGHQRRVIDVRRGDLADPRRPGEVGRPGGGRRPCRGSR